MENNRIQDQLDSIQDRVYNLEKQSIMIARMDENIGFIRKSLETGFIDINKLNDRISLLEKLVPTYDQTVSGFIVAKQELDLVKAELNLYKAMNKGKWAGASTVAIIIVGILNLAIMAWGVAF